MKNLTIFFAISIFLTIIIVIFNYSAAQKNSSGKPVAASLELINPPLKTKAHQDTQFVWQINAPDSFHTSSTAILYSYESSPSALVSTISLKQAPYEHRTKDYLYGDFALPDRFDSVIAFPASGTVYYRLYAKIGNDNYWSEEKSIDVE